MATDRDVDVPDPDHPRIVADDTFGGEPRIRGRRITVLDVHEGVRNRDPEAFADTFELDVADVYAALAYYHAHEEEIDRQRRERARASADLRDRIEDSRPAGVGPDE